MGIFRRKHIHEEDQVDQGITKTEVIEKPFVTVGELEKMVYSTYEEKLFLREKLEEAGRKIKFLEDEQIKLRAAETFSEQSEKERKDLESMLKTCRADKNDLEDKLKEEKGKVIALEGKFRTYQADADEREEQIKLRERNAKLDLIACMKKKLAGETGNWSKDRVCNFIQAFCDDIWGRKERDQK